MSLALLKQQLAELEAPRPESFGLATGLDALDAALPARGIPRGRLTEIAGARGNGKTTLVRHLVERAAADGLWVAYIDAARTLAPRDWAARREVGGCHPPRGHPGGGWEQVDATRPEGTRGADGSRLPAPPWMVRPRTPAKGAWSADILLRSGAFALVVLDGAPPLTRSVAARLTRLARASNAALVVLSEDERSATMLGAALRLRVERRGGKQGAGGWRPPRGHPASEWEQGAERGKGPAAQRMAITVEKGGVRRTVEVSYAVRVARRLCTHPEVPDRRGVAREKSGRDRAAGKRAASTPPTSRTLSRKRRVAEPDFGHENTPAARALG